MNSKAFFSLTVLIAAGLSQAASADGYFLQTDIGGQTQSIVASASRGQLSFSANLTDYDGGRSGAVSAAYAFSLPGSITVRAGPTIGFTDEDDEDQDTEVGARAAIDRWSATSFGATYFLAEASTPQHSWFLLSQVTFAPMNVGIELSRGGSEDYHETTLAVQRRIGDGPVSLRLGYKLTSEEIFAGFSINTY
jgi:hypothetical protein